MRVVNKSGFDFGVATPGSVGFDLRAVIDSPHRDIEPGRRFKFPTGISIALDPGTLALVQPRSGLSINHGVIASTGVIDRDYRGEIAVVLFNFGTEPYRVLKGDRIAQLLVVTDALDTAFLGFLGGVEIVESLDDTTRGASGFGSTGR